MRLLTVWMTMWLSVSLAAEQAVRPVTPRLTVSAGERQYLAFRSGRSARERVFTVRSSQPEILAVQGRLTFLPGRDLAFLALDPLRAGQAVLSVGDARCTVRVRANAIGGPAVRILSPLLGAVLWGKIQATARVGGTASIRRIEWRLDGRLIGQGRSIELVAGGAAGPRLLELRVTDRLGRTSEDACRVLFAPPAAARPLAQAALLRSDAPSLRTQLTVASAGYYQVVLRATGNSAVFPWVEVMRLRTTLTTGSVTTRGRQARHAIGSPFRLSRGTQWISLFYRNNGHGTADNNRRVLRIEQLEIRRVGDRPPDVQQPDVALYCSAVGGEVGGAFRIWASARDAGGLASLAIELDGVVVARRAGRELLYQVPADALLPGRHLIQAVAVDRAGNRNGSRRLVLQRLPYRGRAPETHWLQPTSEALADPEALGGRSWRLPAKVVVRVRRAGRYRLRLIAQAAWPQRVRISTGERSVSLRVTAPAFAPSSSATITLGHGKHTLSIGRSSVGLLGLELQRQARDDRAPWAEIVYPAAGATVGPGEMVLARVSDNDRVALVELLCDGRVISRSSREGLAGLWLHGRGLSPGRHSLQLRVTDVSGNLFLSSTRSVRLRAAGSRMTRTERAIHLLRRLGLGSNPSELALLLRDGESRWWREQLGQRQPAFAEFHATEHWLPSTPAGLRRSTLAFCRYTRGVVRERLANFFDNHFNTSIDKTGLLREWDEREVFRRLALGRFAALLRASSRSPAMLTYLDNTRNRRGRLNENFARELLELHTLGVGGGYAQSDVEAVARIFTGWGVARVEGHPWWRFRFSAADHDGGAKRALGIRFDAARSSVDGTKLLRILAAHPATAQRMAHKLTAALVADDPPARLVRRARRAYLASGGEIRAVIRALVEAPSFFDRRYLGAKLADPFELVLGLSRGRLAAFHLTGLDHMLASMGQPLFGCNSPDGYPERAAAWMGSAALLGRWNFAEYLAARMRLEVPPGSREMWLDDLSASLLGRPLRPVSLRAVLASGARTRREIAALILQMPEAQRH